MLASPRQDRAEGDRIWHFRGQSVVWQFGCARRARQSRWAPRFSASRRSRGAADPAERLVPLLIDLPGWSGEEAQWQNLSSGGVELEMAMREYAHGEGRATATITHGRGAQSAAPQAGPQAGSNDSAHMDSSEGSYRLETIDGFPVAIVYNEAERGGAVTVALNKEAVFALTFEKLGLDDARALAKRFDWKAIKSAIGK